MPDIQNQLGTLEAVPLRKIWAKETEFSAWLAQPANIKLLGNELHLDMLSEETEAGVGDFSADILAQEDGGSRKIIIENQYGETDHKHLGQIITYASGRNADVLIWIVEKARDEHRAAIQWLNENTASEIGVFLVQIAVYKIGNSVPAPKFTVLESPNDWLKSTRSVNSGNVSENGKKRAAWWNSFMDYAMKRDSFRKLFNRRKGGPDNWLVLPLGSSKYQISLTAKTHQLLGVEVYIPDDKELYQQLFKHKDAIEKELGFQMDWQPLPEKRAARIEITKNGDFTDLDHAAGNFLWYCEKAEVIRKVFPKYAK
jgi:hypothetical protein